MAANQLVRYFDEQEGALRFTLAASSIISAERPPHGSEAGAIAVEIRKGCRITTEGVLNVT